MKKRVLITILLILLGTELANAQETLRKAREIIERAKKTALKRTDKINNIYLKFEAVHKNTKAEIKKKGVEGYSFFYDLWIEMPDKIKSKKLTKYENNETLEEKILNHGNFSENIMFGMDGEFYETSIKKLGDPQKIKERDILKFNFEAFSLVFPILLEFGNLDFNFVGIAKTGEQKADVVETTVMDSHQIRLFFDQNTHLLLMITSQFFDEEKKSQTEQKFFFSDYKENTGIHFAHRIIIQENNEVVEERQVKAIAFNQNWKSNFFDIKK